MKGVFVTGTDTDIGKTLISAWLCAHTQAAYWKPIQSGVSEGDDTQRVADLAGLPPQRIIAPRYRLQEPLSPHEAARREGMVLSLEECPLPSSPYPLVVEGAGGVLVPINDRHLMIDLIAALTVPVIVVAKSGLGTINHTLLTLQALSARSLPILGVVMNGPANPANRQAIEYYGKTKVLAEFPQLYRPSSASLRDISLPPVIEAILS